MATDEVHPRLKDVSVHDKRHTLHVSGYILVYFGKGAPTEVNLLLHERKIPQTSSVAGGTAILAHVWTNESLNQQRSRHGKMV